MNPLYQYAAYFVLLQHYIARLHSDPFERTLCVDALNFGHEKFEVEKSSEFAQTCALVLMEIAVDYAAHRLGEAA